MAALGATLIACGGGGSGGSGDGGGEDGGGEPQGDTMGQPAGDTREQVEEGPPACGAPTRGDDESYYCLDLKVEVGPTVTCPEDEQVECLGDKICCAFLFDRNLTGKENKFAFGSTHIAPAIAFTVSDNIALPVSVVTLNFGIIIGTADKPPSTPTGGEYPFSNFQPEIEVFVKNKTFASFIDGSEGTFNITDWSADEGGLWAGDYQGTIVQETDKDVKLQAEVEGYFHFILPKPQGGQPG